MDVQSVREFCLSLPRVTEDMPYGDDMVVFRICGKIFLHLPLEYAEPRMAVKLPPELAVELRERYPGIIVPSWHLNKTHWSDIFISGYFSDEQLQEWVRISYDLVYSKLPKRLKSSDR